MRNARSLIIVLAAIALIAASASNAAGRICLSADTLTFGQRVVGTSASASVVVSNCGTEAWSFTDVSPHSATNPAYRIDSACVTGMTLTQGASCAVDVHFEPQSPGQASGALWLHNTTSTPDQLITFYGRGIDAQAGTSTLQFVPAIADFGTQTVGRETPSLVVALKNAGPSPLVPSALVLNGRDAYDFRGTSSSGDCGIGRAIAAGGMCTLHLFFAPRDIGQRQATLVVDAPQLASLAFLTLTGQGQPSATDADTIDVVEFHNPRDGQYFITADSREIGLLDAGALGADWSRTGASFRAWSTGNAPDTALPVCRFFGTPGVGPNSHFYTAYERECGIVRNDPNWIEEGVTFRARLPLAGTCDPGDTTVLRLWKANESVTASRHRYVVDPAVAGEMQREGWVLEGPVFCAP
jgi:hypothetical protein